jgi:hypothetical protein
MRISSFLTFIIFCFLLFLEEVTQEQLTFRNLDAGFTMVSTSLWCLHSVIGTLAQKDTLTEINNRINDFIINKVQGNLTALNSKGDKGVKKGIRITLQVDKIQASIDPFLKSSNACTPEALNELLNGIGKIWDDEIQPRVNEALNG